MNQLFTMHWEQPILSIFPCVTKTPPLGSFYFFSFSTVPNGNSIRASFLVGRCVFHSHCAAFFKCWVTRFVLNFFVAVKSVFNSILFQRIRQSIRFQFCSKKNFLRTCMVGCLFLPCTQLRRVISVLSALFCFVLFCFCFAFSYW